ncbi:MAG: EamA family transporter, partial [Bacteroidota bacterium]
GASRAGVLKVITPIFAIIGGVVLLNEIITIPAWIGIIIVLAGVVLISIETAEKKDRLAVTEFAAPSGGDAVGQKKFTKWHGNIPLKGLILGLIASLFFAGGNVCRKVGVTYLPNPLMGVTIGSLVALVSAVSVQLALGKGGQMIAALKNINRSYLFSGIATALALYCLFWSLELTSISVASSIGASEALFTILAGKALLSKKEYLNWRLIIGALVVIGGVIMLITM